MEASLQTLIIAALLVVSTSSFTYGLPLGDQIYSRKEDSIVQRSAGTDTNGYLFERHWQPEYTRPQRRSPAHEGSESAHKEGSQSGLAIKPNDPTHVKAAKHLANKLPVELAHKVVDQHNGDIHSSRMKPTHEAVEAPVWMGEGRSCAQ
ncbi:hypothetical protein BT96DRAFT_1065282 [Gymnopus androsaceus JB14]|uniref:Uncharacterized protein n=1 Tax=Gymnopus androsaceus JB14 TaxID=1447944 RepID=A0A6A4GWE4_9AGAR|nr:hypothetical protein BT96DRAFT_1065282 [Gymnopus androsaceus JB14]